MEYLIASGIALNLLLLAVIGSKRNKIPSDRYLMLFLGYAIIRQAYLVLEQNPEYQFNTLMLLGKGLYLLNAPFFFLYIYSLAAIHPITKKLVVILFGPFILYVLNYLYFDLFIFSNKATEIKGGLLYIDSVISLNWLVFVILFLLIEPIYLTWFYFLLKQYRRKITSNLSDIKYHHLGWLKLIFGLWLVMAVVLVPISTFSLLSDVISNTTLEFLIQSVSVIFYFAIGYFGFKQTALFGTQDVTEPEQSKYSRSGLSEADAKQLHAKLLNLIEEQKPYLEGNLRAKDLAAMLNISVNHLSEVLNTQQNQNFFDFIG